MTGWPLEPGEQLRWEGRPDPGFSLAPVANTVWQLVLVWSGCAVLAVVIMAFAGATEFAGLMLAGFAVFIALQVLIVGWWNMRARGNADYAVTDRRVLIRNRRHPAFGRAITPFDPEMVTLRPTSPPGVLIGKGPLLFSGEAGGTMATAQDFCLDMVEEAEHVAQLVREAARGNAPDTPDPVHGIAVTARARRYRIKDA